MRQIQFSEGSIFRNILRSALPMLAAQIINLLYNIVDRIYIGRIPGEGTVALGAAGLCFSVIIFISAFTNMYGSGGAPLCSIERGRGRRAKAEEIMNVSCFLLVSTGLFITAAGELAAEPVLRLLGASDTNLVFALPYLRIYLLGTIFSMLATGLNPYINAQGFAGAGMFTVVIGAVCNLLLDPVFIFVLGMGVRGAALATVLSQGLSAAFVLRFLGGRQAELRLRLMTPADFLGHLDTAADIVSLGLSSFVMSATNFLVSAACNNMLSGYGGDLYVSIMTVVSSVRQMLDTPVLAIGDGTSPVLSFNYGARRPDNVRRSILIMTILGVSYTLVSWLLLLWKPGLFIGIFTPDKEMIRDAVPALHLYFFAFPFQALQISGQTTFKALNKKKRAIFFSIFRKVIIVVPLTILLPGVFGMGVNGVFMAEPISNFVGGLASFTTMLLTILPELKRMEQDPLKAPAGDLS